MFKKFLEFKGGKQTKRTSRSRPQCCAASSGSEMSLKPLQCGTCGRIQEPANSWVEQWLDGHGDFLIDYFMRKATKPMIENWLIAHQEPIPPALSHMSSSRSGSPNSRASSGASTPARKISAQEFEKRGYLRPMVCTTPDGQPTFLEPVMCEEEAPVRPADVMVGLSQDELVMELVKDICNDLDVDSLCFKILKNCCHLLQAHRCSLFLVHGDGEHRDLVSQLFDVHVNSTKEQCLEQSNTQQHFKVKWGEGLTGYVAKTGQALNISDAYKDSRFNPEVDRQTGYFTKSILCMPIFDFNGDVVGVAEAINKVKEPLKDDNVSPHLFSSFCEIDEKEFQKYLSFCGIGIRNARLYERSKLETLRSQLLLDLARIVFQEQTSLSQLMSKILLNTISLLQCGRCQVLLVDTNRQNIFYQVFELAAEDIADDGNCTREVQVADEPRFSINSEITSTVAKSGIKINIPDAYCDSRFDSKTDSPPWRTTSILCMPIRNGQGQVVAVSQFVNKHDGTPFNDNDENLYEAFAIFCGMGITNTQMYEDAHMARVQQQVALEVMAYHQRPDESDVEQLKVMEVPTASHFGLYDFTFTDTVLKETMDTLTACIRMFHELDLVNYFRIDYEVLCRWLLTVKKGYRPVAYHNWRHAFTVAQTMFCMIKNSNLCDLLCKEEWLALLVGCISHDLDHRGLNNQFQVKTVSLLGQLYSSSTMEKHHCNMCMLILHTDGTELLSNLPEDKYKAVVNIIEMAILATDLAQYFKFRDTFKKQVEVNDWGVCHWREYEKRNLLRSMLMTGSDVSSIVKPWKVQRQIAMDIYREFFEQGDIEKSMKIDPAQQMDRNNIGKLPVMQVEFINDICLPAYEVLNKFSPKLSPLLEGCLINRENWELMIKQDQNDVEKKCKDDT